MDKNSNLYKAIEEAIIKPQAAKMKNIEEIPHEFSEQYNQKIEETSVNVCGKNVLKKTHKSQKKISVKTFSIIAAAAVLAGAITVTASSSIRKMIYKLFMNKDDKISYSSSIENTDITEFIQTPFTAPANTDIPVTSVTTALSTENTTAKTSLTSVSSVNTASEESHLPTSITTVAYIPSYHNINVNQRPSMQTPSRPTTVSTAPENSENSQTTTTLCENVIDNGLSTKSTTTEDKNGEPEPSSPILTEITEITEINIVTTDDSIMQPEPSTTSSNITEHSEPNETSDNTYTTTIKIK